MHITTACHCFGSTWVQVVIETNGHPVRARRHDRDQIALRKGEHAVVAEKIPAVAYRTDEFMVLCRRVTMGPIACPTW